MAKTCSIDAVLNYSWEQVAAAWWLRYPNPFSNHVLTEDVLDRFIDDAGCLHTRRLFKKTNSMPKWVAAIVPNSSPKDMWIVEDSVCDYANKTHIVRTVNAGYSNIMKLTETSVISQASTSSSLWSRHVHAISRLYGVAGALQIFAIERYKRNASNALKGYQIVLSHLYNSPSAPEPSEFAKKLKKLEKLRQTALKAGEIAVDKGEELVHSGLGAAGVQFKN